MCKKLSSCVVRLIDTYLSFTFSALTLLVGWQEGHPAHKNLSDEVLAWLSLKRSLNDCVWCCICVNEIFVQYFNSESTHLVVSEYSAFCINVII